jgi:hypothetical protein
VSTPARYLLWAQVGFFLSLALCVLIEPEGLNDNHGWSFYESRRETFVPYALGVLCGILLIAYASTLLERSAAPRELATGLRLLALFLFFDLATPDTVNSFFFWAHDLASTLLFLFQLGFAIWLVRSVWRTRAGVVLVVVQFVGGLVAMFSQLQLIPLLGLGILVFQLSFGVLLVCATAPLHSAVSDSASVEEIPAPAVN